jgi:hypothetical protein
VKIKEKFGKQGMIQLESSKLPTKESIQALCFHNAQLRFQSETNDDFNTDKSCPLNTQNFLTFVWDCSTQGITSRG